MIVSIQKAIELTGVSRSTIQRHIKAGKLSRTEKGIDTAELIRVYGELKSGSESVKAEPVAGVVGGREQWLIEQVEALKHDLKELKAESLEREKQAIEREERAADREKRLMALLEHQAGTVAPGAGEKVAGGFFGKLFK